MVRPRLLAFNDSRRLPASDGSAAAEAQVLGVEDGLVEQRGDVLVVQRVDDLVHNFGDALTAIPLGIAFLLRSFVAEKRAGYFVVLAILISALIALWQSVERLVNPQQIDDLWPLAAAGLVGFIGNEIAAEIRTRAGKRLDSPALIADGAHARTDALVSLAVVGSAILLALGFELGDPLIGLTITAVILRITFQSFRTVQADPGDPAAERPSSR